MSPESGRSPGEGIGYPLQYSWASLVAQTVKNPPEMQETWVRSLGSEDPLEEGMATHSSTLAWKIPMDREAWQATVHGVAESDMTLRLRTAQNSHSEFNETVLKLGTRCLDPSENPPRAPPPILLLECSYFTMLC